jgi:hypothetical protein
MKTRRKRVSMYNTIYSYYYYIVKYSVINLSSETNIYIYRTLRLNSKIKE